MNSILLRRKIFLDLCEKNNNVNDNPFDWGSFKMFWGRAVSADKCTEQFLQWKSVCGRRE